MKLDVSMQSNGFPQTQSLQELDIMFNCFLFFTLKLPTADRSRILR